MLTAIQSLIQSYLITGVDARFHVRYWNKLEETALVFDPIPHRGVTVFGRISDTHESLRVYLDSFSAPLDDPSPQAASTEGFDYHYLDDNKWQPITRQAQKAFQDDCVVSLKAIEDEIGNLRILYDISACH